MLTPIDDAAPVVATTTTTTTEPAPDKQICVKQNSAGAVAYTVPAGRKFVGWFGHQYGIQSYYCEITTTGTSTTTIRYYGGLGAEPYNQRNPTHDQTLTLLAGTSLKNSPSGSNCYVLGVESDA
tara:strand:- start:295 stop:666 length:372 start_codon:yes stop_codon:yes gene_type:complete